MVDISPDPRNVYGNYSPIPGFDSPIQPSSSEIQQEPAALSLPNNPNYYRDSISSARDTAVSFAINSPIGVPVNSNAGQIRRTEQGNRGIFNQADTISSAAGGNWMIYAPPVGQSMNPVQNAVDQQNNGTGLQRTIEASVKPATSVQSKGR